MPTTTYTPLANITLGANVATVTFSSIAQTYRDLVLVMNGKSSTTNYLGIRFNSDSSATNYSIEMFGDGTSASSNALNGTNFLYLQNNTPWNTGALGVITANIFDYSQTDKHKTVLSRSSKSDTSTQALAGRWANTLAITSITVLANTGQLAAGTTLALYGIAA